MNIPIIILAVFVFLITTMYLERSEYCAYGIRKVLGSSSFALIGYLVATLFVTTFILLFYYGYIL